MQTQRTKKSNYLFQVILDHEEQNSLVQLEYKLLQSLIQRCSKFFHKHIERLKAIYIFLANYKNIIELHSKIFSNQQSINICLHFALLFSHHLLRENRHSQARAILKQTEQYEDLYSCDIMLLSICLSNLTVLYSKSGKIFKSLSVALRAISYLQHHLQELKISKSKSKIVEDGVVFVNLLHITQKIIQKIIRTNHKQFFKHLFKIINRLGYSFAHKYFGSDSIFTQKFVILDNSLYLPVFKQDDSSSQVKPVNEFESKIAKQLVNICNILKDLNLEPQVYYIKEHLVQENQSKSQSTIKAQVLEALPQPQPQPRSVSHSQSLIINNWEVEITIMRQNSLSSQKTFSYLGHLHFKYAKRKAKRDVTISQQRLIKILNVINTYDALPYEYELKRMNSHQFFNKFLVNFIFISDDGDLIVYPRAISLINVFQTKFCGEKSFIFVNHINFRRFRVGICPQTTSDTMYLQIEFKYKDITSIFNFKEIENNKINEIFHKYYTNDNFQQIYSYQKYKQIQIANPVEFKSKIINILKQFQQFIIEQQENLLSQISTVINFTDIYYYYQYTEFKEGIGQFHELKYRSNANHIEVSTKNTFKTHTPTGLTQAKGNTIYSPQQFLKDFSMNLKSSKRYLPAFSNIIIQKYYLKIFQQPIQQNQQDMFEQNSINELPLTSKFYKRKFLQFQDYQLPITIQVVSINNEKPVGIRVNAYEPIKCIQSGIFIHLTPQYWEKPTDKTEKECEKDQSSSDKIKKSTQDYNFKKGYFLTKWMQEEGFTKIFNRLTIVNRSLQIKGLNSKFCRLDELFD